MNDTPTVMLDARKLGDGGIGVYIENLVDGLLDLCVEGTNACNLVLLVPSEQSINEHNLSGEYVAEVLSRWRGTVPFVIEPSKKYSLEEYLLLAWRQRRSLHDVDLFHAPHYTLPLFLPVPAITTVHDIIHVSFPDTPYHQIVGRTLIGSALRRSAHVVTVSEASRREIVRQFGKSAAPVTVVPNAVRRGIGCMPKNIVDHYRKEANLIRPYCVFVGNDRPHKRFSLLLEVWASLAQRRTTRQKRLPYLVAVGSRYSDAIKQQVSELGLCEYVKFFTDVSVADLNLLYNGAEAVVIPSREEGFGLVALEAFACGTRVISTPMPSIREICQDYAIYSDDFSSGSFYDAVLKCLNDVPHRKDEGIVRRQRASYFTRQQGAKKTLEVYHKTLRFPHSPLLAHDVEIEQMESMQKLEPQEEINCKIENQSEDSGQIH